LEISIEAESASVACHGRACRRRFLAGRLVWCVQPGADHRGAPCAFCPISCPAGFVIRALRPSNVRRSWCTRGAGRPQPDAIPDCVL